MQDGRLVGNGCDAIYMAGNLTKEVGEKWDRHTLIWSPWVHTPGDTPADHVTLKSPTSSKPLSFAVEITNPPRGIMA